MALSTQVNTSAATDTRDPSIPLSEEQIHSEHLAALDATVFKRAGSESEVVYELDSGQLRLRAGR